MFETGQISGSPRASLHIPTLFRTLVGISILCFLFFQMEGYISWRVETIMQIFWDIIVKWEEEQMRCWLYASCLRLTRFKPTRWYQISINNNKIIKKESLNNNRIIKKKNIRIEKFLTLREKWIAWLLLMVSTNTSNNKFFFFYAVKVNLNLLLA